MISQPSIWQRFWWRLTPLGRVRLALASVPGSTDLSQTRARLRSALIILRHPNRVADPTAVALLPLVLDQLVELALRQDDLSEATAFLSQLDTTSIAAEVRLGLRWRLIQSLIKLAQRDVALNQARLYVADVHSSPGPVVELLHWSLINTDPSQARALAQGVSPHLQTDNLVETLRMLCLAPEEFEDRHLALRIVARTQPALLANWPVLQCQAHLLRARCAEPAEDWQQMFQETQAALALMPDAPEPRYWFARVLLHRGQSLDAEAELSRLPAGGADPRWRRLLQIARLSAQPSLEHVEPCLRVLEGTWGTLGTVEVMLALAALETALRPSVDDPPARLKPIAEFSERVMQVAGELPWIKYNLAVKEICVDHNFEQARAHLVAPVVAPPGGCPSHLLRMVCATALGHVDELAETLKDPTQLSREFSDDKQFFSAVLEVFSTLRSGDVLTNADSLQQRLARTSGRLSRALPVLPAIGTLLQRLLALSSGQIGGEGEHLTFAQFVGVIWAQWLWQRLWMTQTPIAQVAETLSGNESADLHPALLWEHIVWRQEFSAVLSSVPLSAITASLETFKARVLIPDQSIWHRLLDLRSSMAVLSGSAANLNISHAKEDMPIPLCPWLPADSPFQTLAQREGQIELCYLEGRHALRSLSPNQALRWFRQAEKLIDGKGPASALISARLAPILIYWTGVALAHLDRLEEARKRLKECLDGAKGIEALAQLGLVALARGNTDEAATYLERIPQPLPASARYLAALVAERMGNVDKAHHWLKEIEKVNALNAGVYAAATHRLEGAIAERTGDYSAAAEGYRSALSVWVSDPVSAARLARVWLHESYQRTCQGQEIVPGPALNECWTAIGSIGWATLLPLLHDWLAAAAGNAEHLPRLALPKSLDASQSAVAVKRLVLRVLLANEQAQKAAEVAQRWVGDETSNPYLVAAETILSNADDLIVLCQNGGTGAGRKQVNKFASRLAHLRTQLPGDPAIAFWHDAARVVLDPTALVREEMFASALSGEDRPMPQRALAAVVNLFSGITEQRERAVAVCEQLIAKGVFTDEATKVAVSCLVALVSASDAEFLDRFSAVEKNLSVLPCNEAELYVAVCQARLRVGAIDAITHGFIPDSLAELMHPEVRRVVGLAYAQRAARNAEKDVRAALNDLEQAVELLGLPEVP